MAIKLRGGTAAEWTAANPVLAAREPGVESDTGKIKVGNGSTVWNDLAYSSGTVTFGTTPGTAAQGNDTRIVGAAQKMGGNVFTGTQDFTNATVIGLPGGSGSGTGPIDGGDPTTSFFSNIIDGGTP